jgi:hypothetical protein
MQLTQALQREDPTVVQASTAGLQTKRPLEQYGHADKAQMQQTQALQRVDPTVVQASTAGLQTKRPL